MRNKISMGLLMLTLLTVPQLSYADWGVAVHVGDRDGRHDRDDRRFYGWHDHPQWGWRAHYLPAGYTTVQVGWHRYYYYDGLYYNYVNGDYVLVSPPVGAYVAALPPDFVPVVINGRTYYTSNGVYYIFTRRGYRCVRPPVVPQPAVRVIYRN